MAPVQVGPVDPAGFEHTGEPADYVEFCQRLFVALEAAVRIQSCSEWSTAPIRELRLRDLERQWRVLDTANVGRVSVTYTVTQHVDSRELGLGVDADVARYLATSFSPSTDSIFDVTADGDVPAPYVFPADPSVMLSDLARRVRVMAADYMNRGYSPETINLILTAVGLEKVPEPRDFVFTTTYTETETVRALDEAAARQWALDNLAGARRGYNLTVTMVNEGTFVPYAEAAAAPTNPF